MTTTRRLGVLAASLGLLASAPAAAPAQTVPTLPDIPSIPGQEKARFKVVVEGTANASAVANGGGDGGAGCGITIKDVDIAERFEYGRGKGVTMEFTRFKVGSRSVISLTRSGRSGDASFAVRGKIQRTVGADGTLVRAPTMPGNPCPVRTERPAAMEGCNREFSLSADLKFVYGAPAGKLKLQPTGKETIGGIDTPVAKCPESELFGQLPGIARPAWPTPLKLPAQRLSARTIFGSGKGFTLRFVAAELGDDEPFPQGFSGKITHEADHSAVARFTRLR